MSVPISRPRTPADKAVVLFHQLDSLKTDQPGTAPLSDRVIARAWDFGAVFVLILLVNFVVGLVAASTGHIKKTPSGVHVDTGALIAFDIVLLVVFVAYEIGPAIVGGRSFGKWRCGLTIVDIDGEPARFRRVLVRFAAWFVPLLAMVLAYSAAFPGMLSFLFFALGILLVAGIWWSTWRHDQQRGWHDRIAGTQVFHAR